MTPSRVLSGGIDSIDTPVVRLEALSVKDSLRGNALNDLNMTLSPGRAFHLFSDSPSSAQILMRCLATLDWPCRGEYFFDGEALSFNRYEGLLPIKRRIAYLYPMASMVRNRTVEENLDYQAHYFGDTDLARHQGFKDALVTGFGIQGTLSFCPEMVSAMEQRRAIVVREFLKGPRLFLAEYPEEFLGHGNRALFIGEIRKILSRGGVFVYTTNFKGFGKELNPMSLRLEKGILSEELEP